MGGVNSGTSSGGAPVERSAATLLLADGDVSDATAAVTPDCPETLVVSVEGSVVDVVDDWRANRGTLPASFGLITFAEFGRSAATGDTTDDGPSRRSLPGQDITVTAMSEAENLPRLGTAITLYLDDWADTDRETLVYVDDLGPLAAENDLESTFQFLHLLVQTVTGIDATLLVRADETATDERTINTLRPLFDAVVDVSDADASPPPALDGDTIRTLLRNSRRRFVLRTLFEDGETGLDRLASRLAAHETDAEAPTEADRTRAFTALASVHVPQLAEAGLVVFDRSDERVRLSDAARRTDRLEGYLDGSFDGT
jgi:hypothetical protein